MKNHEFKKAYLYVVFGIVLICLLGFYGYHKVKNYQIEQTKREISQQEKEKKKYIESKNL